ncbi:MAG: alpha/beta hydrolase [Nannocystaceae bacterium]|nr:alpha/beta hydrolase [Nannocystaceae bacterium]
MQSPLELFRAAPIQRLDVGTTTLSYRVFGSGPALVLVHGWPMSGVTFRSLIAELRHHFTCYVPDLPGAGDSPWDPSVQDLFFDAGRRIGEFVDRLGLEQFAMMGFDSGGAVARIAASQRPGRVFAMVMTNTEVPGHRLPLLEQFKTLAGLPGATTVFRWLLHSKTFLRSKYGFKGAFVDLAQLDGDFREATLEPLRRDPSGMLLSLLHADLDISDHLAEVHAKIDAPLLAVWGDRCGFFPLREGEAMVRDWPVEARLEVVHGQKLMLHEEDPQSVLRVMIPFLREHAPPTLVEANAG